MKERWILALVFFPTALGVLYWALTSGPIRKSPQKSSVITSPADGKLLFISKGGVISIFLALTDVHVQYAPCDCVVESIVHIKGLHHDARMTEAYHNSRNIIRLRRVSDGRIITVTQYGGLVARTVKVFVEKGDRLARGDQMGVILLGSRVDIAVEGMKPLPDVKENMTVKGGLTPLFDHTK